MPPPMPQGMAGALSLGYSAIMASVVIRREATEAANGGPESFSAVPNRDNIRADRCCRHDLSHPSRS